MQRGGGLVKSIVRGEDLSFFGQFVGSMLLENSLSPSWLESEFEKTSATPLPKRTKTKRARRDEKRTKVIAKRDGKTC